MKRKSKTSNNINSSESMYAKSKTAGWLLNILEHKSCMDENFFECLQWVVGDLRPVLRQLEKGLDTLVKTRDTSKARKIVKESASWGG